MNPTSPSTNPQERTSASVEGSGGPLAVDLCCGLLQSQLDRRTDAAINQLVARRTENPEHVSLGVADQRPGAVPAELRLVSDFQDARLAAAFAGARDVGMPPTHPVELGVLIGAACVVGPLPGRISPRPDAAQLASGFPGAVRRTVASVGAGRDDIEVRPAARAVLSPRRDVCLLPASSTPCAAGTRRGAVELVRPYGHEFCGAVATGQVVHSGAIA
jgi:hypothetical protein